MLLFLYKNIHAPLQLAPRSVQKECYEIHNLDDDDSKYTQEIQNLLCQWMVKNLQALAELLI